jgi:hypothetical protein
MICNYERDIVKRKARKDLLAKKLSPATPRIARNRKNFPGDSSFLQLPNAMISRSNLISVGNSRRLNI